MKPYLTKLALLAATLACSCEYEKLPTYSGQDQIYFAYADDVLSMVDELFVHFGYDEPMKPETTLYVGVKVMGSIADVDRPVSFVLVDSLSTATPGRDVELLPELSLVPAGKELGLIALKLKNTAALRDTVLAIGIRLVENESFHADYTKTRFSNVNSSEEKKIVSTEYRVRFDNANIIPRLWFENLEKCNAIFGEFSNTKFELMCSLLGFDRSYFSYTEGNPEELFTARINLYSLSWIQTMNRYLNEFREKHGYALRDEYGNEIKMGSTIN